MLDNYKDVLTIEDVQEILGIGRSKAYQLIRNRTIPSIHIGKTIRVSKLNMINYINHVSNEGYKS